MRLRRQGPEELPARRAEIIPRFDAQVPRRSLWPLVLTGLGGLLAGGAAGALSMYQFDRRLIPHDVPGFEWVPGGSPFDGEMVDLNRVARMPGNPHANSRDPLS